jgi:PAS domain S-box-containing protein
MKKIFRHKKVLILTGVMVIITFLIACTSILLLYNNAQKDIYNRLTDIVQREKTFTLSLLRDSAITETEIVEHLKSNITLGQYGEVVYAKKINDSIEFFISSKQSNQNQKISKNSSFAAPMQRALNKETGYLKGHDYNGIDVYSAYTYVEKLNWGIVAKIPKSEINKPYMIATVIVFILAFVLISISIFILIRITNPIIDKLQKNEKELNIAKEQAEESEKRVRAYFQIGLLGMAITSVEKRWIDVNDTICEILGYTKEELEQKTWLELTHPDDIDIDSVQFNKALNGEIDGYKLEKRFINKNGKIIYTELAVSCLRNPDKSVKYFFALINDITERKKADEKLKGLSNIIENSLNEIYVFDTETLKFDFVNNAVLQNLGYSIEEIKTLTPIDIKPEYDNQNFLEVIKPLLTEKTKLLRFETIHQRKNGTTYPVEVNLQLSEYEGKKVFAAIILDITQRNQAEQALKESENKYRQLFDFMPIGVSIADNSGQLIENNKKAESLLGLSNEEHNKLTIDAKEWKVIRRDGSQMPVEEFASVRALKENRLIENVEMGIYKGENNTTWINVTAVPRISGNGIIISYIDISEKISQEDKLTQYTQELKKLNADKDRFIVILSHDLRSPFSSILGFLDLLTENISDYNIDEIKEYIKIVDNSAKKTFRLLEDTLLWISANSGKIPYEPQKMNFTAICNEVVENLMLTANIKNITIENFATDEVNVFADKNMLKTVLTNLISNSIKFTSKNGRIEIHMEKNHTNFTIIVSDNGIGIKPEILTKLFDISEKVTTAGTENEKGTGFGLLLCKEFVEKHGGKIWVESEFGKGSTFRFTLPLRS